jgi:DNA-binding phage protein
MFNATDTLAMLLADLTAAARQQGWSDSAWARRAGLRKESLCRLRTRSDCDLATLTALATAVGQRLVARRSAPGSTTADGHFPATLDRDDEERLVRLAASGDLSPAVWDRAGPRFFMAGFAVLLASLRGFDRPALLALAAHLHVGSTNPGIFALWLERTPLDTSRLLSQLQSWQRHAA